MPESCEQTAQNLEQWYDSPLEIGTHAFTGFALFMVFALLALGLDLFVDWLENNPNVSTFVLFGLEYAAHSFFAVDLVLFLVFLVKGALRLIKKI